MSDTGTMLTDSVRRLLLRHAGLPAAHGFEARTLPAPLWCDCVEAGFARALRCDDAAPEEAPDASARAAVRNGTAILRECAYHAAPIPLAEAMLANWLADAAGWPADDGIATVALLPCGGAVGTAGTRLERVPWGAAADAVYALAGDGDACRVVRHVAPWPAALPGINLAGEPRDTLVFEAPALAAAAGRVDAPTAWALGALLRSAQMVGAMECTLDLALEHARTRVQFGRPIGSFQAVQQMLAQQANHVAAAAAALDLAVDRWATGDAILHAAIAKSRTGEAAGVVAEISHQVLAAMGFALEHPLQRATRRLWSWRDEFGNEAYWNDRIGGAFLALPADAVWPALADGTLADAAR